MATPFADPLIVTNLTVWLDISSLQGFVYKSVHRYFLQSRRKWFQRVAGSQVVLWWVAPGEIPELPDAKLRLEELDAHGPGPRGFSLARPFDPDGRPMTVPSLYRHEDD